MIEFTAYGKTPRLFKDPMVITEKIDGTNAAVGVVEGWVEPDDGAPMAVNAEVDGIPYAVYAQSRNRLIRPQEIGGKGSDNYGFAEWVWANHHTLARVLGPGLHFGEWWGQGIARNYGMTERTFSLFNTSRWRHLSDPLARIGLGVPKELSVVPVLCINTLDTKVVMDCMQKLEVEGSLASPGFSPAEGICVFLPSSGQTFKVTFEGDKSKWELAQDQRSAA